MRPLVQEREARCQHLEKKLSASEFHPFKTEKRTPRVGGLAASFACGFLKFWRSGVRPRINVSRSFCKMLTSSFRRQHRKHSQPLMCLERAKRAEDEAALDTLGRLLRETRQTTNQENTTRKRKVPNSASHKGRQVFSKPSLRDVGLIN